MRIIMLLALCFSCSSPRFYRVIHNDIDYSFDNKTRGGGLLEFDNYDVYVYPSEYGEDFTVQLEITNRSQEVIDYELNEVTLKGYQAQKYILEQTEVVECESGKRLYRQARNLKIDPTDCYTIWYRFDIRQTINKKFIFKDWGHIRPLTFKFVR